MNAICLLFKIYCLASISLNTFDDFLMAPPFLLFLREAPFFFILFFSSLNANSDIVTSKHIPPAVSITPLFFTCYSRYYLLDLSKVFIPASTSLRRCLLLNSLLSYSLINYSFSELFSLNFDSFLMDSLALQVPSPFYKSQGTVFLNEMSSGIKFSGFAYLIFFFSISSFFQIRLECLRLFFFSFYPSRPFLIVLSQSFGFLNQEKSLFRSLGPSQNSEKSDQPPELFRWFLFIFCGVPYEFYFYLIWSNQTFFLFQFILLIKNIIYYLVNVENVGATTTRERYKNKQKSQSKNIKTCRFRRK